MTELELWRDELRARYDRVHELAEKADREARRLCLALSGRFPLREISVDDERELAERFASWETLELSWSTAAEEAGAFYAAGPPVDVDEALEALEALNPGVDVKAALERAIEGEEARS